MTLRPLWLVCAATLAFVSPARGEGPLARLSWSDALPDEAVVQADGTITVDSEASGVSVTVSSLARPGIQTDRYVVTGEIRYEGVEGKGYVEMWSVFDEGRYFTRTNLDQGPMRALEGSSDWRPIALPFDATGASSPPRELIVNVVLPGAGQVTLRPLTLGEGDASWGAGGGSSFGFWGGLAGALVGVFGGVLGWLGGAGRARGLVLGGFRALAVFGALLLGVGLFGLVSGWAYASYYPPLIVGAVTLMVTVLTMPRLARRYQELELRRMSALDA